MDDKPAKRTRSLAENYCEVYINQAGIGGSAYDLIINGQLTRYGEAGSLVVQDVVTIHNSPQHFKTLVAMMLETIVAYERDFQVLNLPADQAEKGALIEAVRPIVLERIGSTRFISTSSTGQPQPGKQSPDAPKKRGKKP